MQADAIRFCQIDSCRLGGVNEVLAVLLMAAKFGIPVCPHAGGVGLCEYVQHLSIFDYRVRERLAREPHHRVRRSPARAFPRSRSSSAAGATCRRRRRATASRCAPRVSRSTRIPTVPHGRASLARPRPRQPMSATATPTRTTMRAAVLVDVARIEVRDVPVQRPAPHEVLVRVEAVGLCGTDLHIVGRPRELQHATITATSCRCTVAPQILGHEIAGVVEEIGSAVSDDLARRPGDRRSGAHVRERAPRPAMRVLRTGDSHQCEHYAEHGITGLPGGFAEWSPFPAVNTVRVTSGLPAEHAALAEPLGCIVHSSEMISPRRRALSAGPARRGARRSLDPRSAAADRPACCSCSISATCLHFDGAAAAQRAERHQASARRAVRRGDDRSLAASTSSRPCGANAGTSRGAAHRGHRVRARCSAASPALVRKQATVLLYGHGHSGVDLERAEPRAVSRADVRIAGRCVGRARRPTDARSTYVAGARAHRARHDRRRLAHHAPLSLARRRARRLRGRPSAPPTT